MNFRVDVINFGVTDLEATRVFYEKGLGCSAPSEQVVGGVGYSLGPGASMVRLMPRAVLAECAQADPSGTGFRGFTMSLILDSADQVDDLIAQATAAGAVVSKPTRNALWGYSAYLTDPSGVLWKIASSKRRPLLARSRSAEPGVVDVGASEVPVTIGVADMPRAREFYSTVLGFEVKKKFPGFVSFEGGSTGSDVGMYKWGALASDAAVAETGSGFRAIMFEHEAKTAADVDRIISDAVSGGADLIGAAHRDARGNHQGYFSDLDGFTWRITASTAE